MSTTFLVTEFKAVRITSDTLGVLVLQFEQDQPLAAYVFRKGEAQMLTCELKINETDGD